MSPTLPDGRRLILASTSSFRRELLARLGLPFAVAAPNVDETRLPEETAPALVARLAKAKAAGRTVVFYTGLCLLDSASGHRQVAVEEFRVVFRALTPAMIEAYLQREQPYQCAGSFKSEGLGIALFERLEGADPTSLIGLPLIRLTRMLEATGVMVL